MKKKLTPLQSVAKQFNDYPNTQYSGLVVAKVLEMYIPEERKFDEDIWEAGANSAYGSVSAGAGCDFNSVGHLKDKEQYFSQFEPIKEGKK